MERDYNYIDYNITNNFKRIIIGLFTIIIIGLWIMGTGTIILVNEFTNTGIIGLFGIIFLSIWIILLLLYNSIYLINPIKIENLVDKGAWVTPLISLPAILVSFSMLFIFSSIRNIMFDNIYLKIFWISIIIFYLIWFIFLVREDLKK